MSFWIILWRITMLTLIAPCIGQGSCLTQVLHVLSPLHKYTHSLNFSTRIRNLGNTFREKKSSLFYHSDIFSCHSPVKKHLFCCSAYCWVHDKYSPSRFNSGPLLNQPAPLVTVILPQHAKRKNVTQIGVFEVFEQSLFTLSYLFSFSWEMTAPSCRTPNTN